MNEEEFEKVKEEFKRRMLRQLFHSIREVFCNKGYHSWFELGNIKICCHCFKSEPIKKEV